LPTKGGCVSKRAKTLYTIATNHFYTAQKNQAFGGLNQNVMKIKKLTRPLLISYLQEYKMIEDVDHTLIEELFFNIRLMSMAKDDINERGVLVDVSANNNGVMQKNQSISTYESALSNIMKISKLLGLSPKDRLELGLEKPVENDGF